LVCLAKKEITVHVNEKQDEENHKVEFKTSNLTSSDYLYKLRADNFIDLKKMTLIS
jgi:hypothetical protein